MKQQTPVTARDRWMGWSAWIGFLTLLYGVCMILPMGLCVWWAFSSSHGSLFFAISILLSSFTMALLLAVIFHEPVTNLIIRVQRYHIRKVHGIDLDVVFRDLEPIGRSFKE